MKSKIISLLVCLAMMCAAAVTVNKSLFCHSFASDTAGNFDSFVDCDTVSLKSDGSIVIHTIKLCDDPGYAGLTPLDITVHNGIITEISAQENDETPHFFEKAASILDGFTGKTPAEIADMKIDAVSGATYSSKALIANVKSGVRYYLNKTESENNQNNVPWKMWIALAVTLSACIVPLFVKNKYYRYAQLLANVIVLGFWCGQFLDYALMLRYLSYGISLPAGLTAIVMIIAAFIFPLFGHPQHYCNHICPLGACQQLTASLFNRKIKIGKKTLEGLDIFRKSLWFVLMICLWADIFTKWMEWELFQAFMVNTAPIVILIAAAVFIALSALIARPYCRFICPTGSLIKQAENL